jgi:hypothetical protein
MRPETAKRKTASAVPTEARVSLRSLFIVTSVVALAAAFLAPILRSLSAPALVAALVFATITVAVALLTILFLGGLRRRAEKAAGPVLWQFAPHSYFLPRMPRVMAIICGVALLCFGGGIWFAFGILFVFFFEESQAGRTIWHILFNPMNLISAIQLSLLSTAGIAIIWWNKNVRFCERGIVRRNVFIDWKLVGRYYWDACTPDVLVISWGGFAGVKSAQRPTLRDALLALFFAAASTGGQFAVRVPPEERDAVITFLNDKKST